MNNHDGGCDVEDHREYFLSSYLAPPGSIESFCLRHDQSVALWAVTAGTVELVRLWELERLSGQKHHSWPLLSAQRAADFIAELLGEERLTWDDISATWGTPGLPKYDPIALPAGTEPFPAHSIAHLFSGLLMDSGVFERDTIIALAVDHAPDLVLDAESKQYWYAGAVVHAGAVTFVPVESPAILYSMATQAFHLEPGTLMALASACRTTIAFDVDEAVRGLDLHGRREKSMRAGSLLVGSIVEAAVDQLGTTAPDPRFSAEENLRSAVMKVVQECCLRIMERNVQRLCSLAGVPPGACYLSVTGGFALNCPANSHLMDRFGFKGLLVPPCPNDSGQALGYGLLGLYASGRLRTRRFALGTAYHGSDRLDLDAALVEFQGWIESVSPFSPDVFVSDVQHAPLAWVDGAAEIGPRALGHRSLLADPRTMASKERLNTYKGRQWWRPVAPVVLAGEAHRWFEATRPSPYMLETAQVRTGALPRIPAIAHLDGSARLQTVSLEADTRLHAALTAFHEATGVPLLCNTSLNDRHEPIANTAAEALNFCVRKGITVAYVDGRRVALRRADTVALDAPGGPKVRRVGVFEGQDADQHRIWREWRERGYSEQAMFLLTRMPELRPPGGPVAAPRYVNRLAAYCDNADPAFRAGFTRFREVRGPAAEFDTVQPGWIVDSDVLDPSQVLVDRGVPA